MSLEFEYLLYYLKNINNNNRKKHKIIASQSTVIIDQSIKMNEPFHSTAPEPRKIGVWTEGAPVETREFVMPKKSSESIDDIPTIPDLDDLQDILEMEILKPPMSEQQDKETVNTLAEVRGVSGSVEGIDAALEVLKSYIPVVEPDTADTVWTVDTLIAQLAEELLTE